MMIILFYDKNDDGGGSRICEKCNRKIDNIKVDINIIKLILDNRE